MGSSNVLKLNVLLSSLVAVVVLLLTDDLGTSISPSTSSSINK